MARPLWRELRRARRQRSAAPPGRQPLAPLPPRPHFRIAVISLAIAIAAIVLNQTEGATLRGREMDLHLWAVGTAGAFLVFGSLAVRRFATQIGRLIHSGGGPTAGAALRLILTITGSILVVIVTIGMLGVSATRLLAAAGVTGIIVGLAAQQSLGNVFAGIVLMVARPFVVGQRIKIRSGALNGPIEGEVLAMGLTYVELETDEGLVKVPNLAMIASAVGPAPEPKPTPRELYVNRTIPKRPPRTVPAHPPRRPTRPAPLPRQPREIIERMRQRHQGEEQGDGGEGGEGDPRKSSS